MHVHAPKSQCPGARLRQLDRLLSSARESRLGCERFVGRRTLSCTCKSSKKHSFLPAGTSMMCAATRGKRHSSDSQAAQGLGIHVRESIAVSGEQNVPRALPSCQERNWVTCASTANADPIL